MNLNGPHRSPTGECDLCTGWKARLYLRMFNLDLDFVNTENGPVFFKDLTDDEAVTFAHRLFRQEKILNHKYPHQVT